MTDLTMIAGIMGLFTCIVIIIIGVGMDENDDD